MDNDLETIDSWSTTFKIVGITLFYLLLQIVILLRELVSPVVYI